MRFMIHSAEKYNEFIAADTSYDIICAEKILKLLGNINKNAVAEKMTAGIIDFLEVIDIHYYECIIGLTAVSTQEALDKSSRCLLVIKLGERITFSLVDKSLICDLYGAYILDLADSSAVFAVYSTSVSLDRKSVPPVIQIASEFETKLKNTAVNAGFEIVADNTEFLFILFKNISA